MLDYEKKEIRKQIEAAIRLCPGLDYAGITWAFCQKGLDKAFHDSLVDLPDRKRLLEATDEFVRACVWLGKQGRRKTVNREISSYGLKHMAEWPEQPLGTSGYISNGVLIAAAIHLGFTFKPAPVNGNTAYLNISLAKERNRRRAPKVWRPKGLKRSGSC